MFRRFSNKATPVQQSFSNPQWDDTDTNGDIDANEMVPMLPTQSGPAHTYESLYAELPESIGEFANPMYMENGPEQHEDDDPPLWAQPRQSSPPEYSSEHTPAIHAENLREQLNDANQHAETTRQENIRLFAQNRDLRNTITHLQGQLQQISSQPTQREQMAITRADQLQRTLNDIQGGASALQSRQEIDRLVCMLSELQAQSDEQKRHINDLESIIAAQNALTS